MTHVPWTWAHAPMPPCLPTAQTKQTLPPHGTMPPNPPDPESHHPKIITPDVGVGVGISDGQVTIEFIYFFEVVSWGVCELEGSDGPLTEGDQH